MLRTVRATVGASWGALLLLLQMGSLRLGRAGVYLRSSSNQGQPSLLGKLVSPSVPQFPCLQQGDPVLEERLVGAQETVSRGYSCPTCPVLCSQPQFLPAPPPASADEMASGERAEEEVSPKGVTTGHVWKVSGEVASGHKLLWEWWGFPLPPYFPPETPPTPPHGSLLRPPS